MSNPNSQEDKPLEVKKAVGLKRKLVSSNNIVDALDIKAQDIESKMKGQANSRTNI